MSVSNEIREFPNTNFQNKMPAVKHTGILSRDIVDTAIQTTTRSTSRISMTNPRGTLAPLGDTSTHSKRSYNPASQNATLNPRATVDMAPVVFQPPSSVDSSDDEFDYEFSEEVVKNIPMKDASFIDLSNTAIVDEDSDEDSDADGLDAYTSSQIAANALADIRRSIAKEKSELHAKEIQEKEERIMATSVVQNASQGGGTKSNSLVTLEEDNEEENSEDENESSNNADGSSGIVLSVNARKPQEGAEPSKSTIHHKLPSAKPPIKGIVPPAGAIPKPALANPSEDFVENDDGFLDATTVRNVLQNNDDHSGPVMSYKEATRSFLSPGSLYISLSGITPEVADPEVGCFVRLFRKKLPSTLVSGRNNIFALARTPYSSDTAGSLHSRVMTSLMRKVSELGRLGPNISWIDIGFQREGDFSTDLRGAGMLGPLQILYLLENHPRLSKSLWEIATAPLHPFPFALQLLSFTGKTLQALRFGRLNELIVSVHKMLVRYRCGSITSSKKPYIPQLLLSSAPEEDVLVATNLVYATMIYHFVQAWKQDSKASLKRIGHITQRVVDLVGKNPGKALESLGAWETS